MITVTITSINEIVEESEGLTVDVDVANEGDTAEQDITIELLDFDDIVVDSETLYPSDEEDEEDEEDEFQPDTTESITLEWNMQPEDTAEGTITVQSEDDSATHNIIGVLSYSENITYLEGDSSNRHVAQVNFATYDRGVADTILNRLEEVINEVGQEVIDKLEQDV